MKKNKRFWFILLVFFLAFLTLYSLSNIFRIKQIIINGNKKEIIGINRLSSKNLFLLNTSKYQEELKKSNYFIKEVSVMKMYPDKVIINIANRTPIFIVQNSRIKALMDEEGMISATTDYEDGYLPVLDIGESNIQIGSIADWQVIKAKEILLELKKTNLEGITMIKLDKTKGNYSIFIGPSTEVLIPPNFNSQTFAASLQLIISRFRIEGKNISKIDFRFDKPIVVLKNGEKISSNF